MTTPRVPRRTLVAATVTPLASIFGSGFLIVVPVLEAGFGRWGVPAMASVCLAAFLVGTAVRHNMAVNAHDPFTRRTEVLSAVLIAVAYAVSVGLYLQIMSGYAFGYAHVDSLTGERMVTTAVLALLVAIGVLRGFSGLSHLERMALAVTLVMIVVMTVAFAGKVLELQRDGALVLPAPADGGLLTRATLLGGILITVQGFETSRYLGTQYDVGVRIRTSRWSQFISTGAYLAFVGVCTPLMATTVPGAAPDHDLLELVRRTLPLLALPLALTGVFSQFSAAIADLVTAVGNVVELGHERLRPGRAYVALGGVAALVVWTFPTLTLVAVASRAFAAFYAVQCVTAAHTARSRPAAAGFLLLAGAMLFVVLLAAPVG